MTVPSGHSRLMFMGFLATAFLSGAVVMALEILGSRLLAPVFGNSLFVWGALIGVVLAAMRTRAGNQPYVSCADNADVHKKRNFAPLPVATIRPKIEQEYTLRLASVQATHTLERR